MSALPRAVGKFERLCWERHERDLELTRQTGGHPKGFRFVPELGERVVRFVEKFCKHHKGEWAGQPLILEEWQRRIIRIVFGWVRADGTRRFRTAYIEIPRKNGKSLFASAVGLYLLVGDQEPGAEVYSFATKEDQARLLWIEAGKTVRKSDLLTKHVKVLADSITFDASGAFFRPLGSDSDTQDGLNPHAGIADELHAHKTRGMWDVIQSGMGARREPLMLAITTAGVFRQESIGWEKHDYATKVLEGVFDDDAFFAFISAPDEGDDLFSDVAFEKANPNWGVSVKPTWVRERAAEAKLVPSAMAEFQRKQLNVWSQATTAWLSLEQWKACDPTPAPRAELEESLVGLMCRAGLDLSSKLDLTALVLEFPTDRGYELICRFWLPEDRAAEEAARGRTHYVQWAKEGWLTLTPGAAIDYDFIKAELARLTKRYRIESIAFDPWGAQQLVNDLVRDGIATVEEGTDKPVCVECRQGYQSLSEPTKDLQVSVVKGQLKHGGNPVLRWCASNVVVTTDPTGNIKPDKSKASGKIDGIVALIMARSRSVLAPPEEENPYQSRGFLTL